MHFFFHVETMNVIKNTPKNAIKIVFFECYSNIISIYIYIYYAVGVEVCLLGGVSEPLNCQSRTWAEVIPKFPTFQISKQKMNVSMILQDIAGSWI